MLGPGRNGSVLKLGCTMSDTSDSLSSGPMPDAPTAGWRMMIDVPGGRRRIDHLRPGDPVSVQGGPPLPVIWHGIERVHSTATEGTESGPVHGQTGGGNRAASGHLQGCIRIAARGADLFLAPRRCLVLGLKSGERVLVRARHLAHETAIARIVPAPADIVHHLILLQKHAIITANGVALESFFPDHAALSRLAVPEQSALRGLIGIWGSADGYDSPVLRVLSRTELAEAVAQGEVTLPDVRQIG